MSRRRSTRALTNDDAIRDAAVKLVVDVGIDAISFRDVGREAGLTHGALYARFEDVEELLVDLWNAVLSHRAIAMISLAVAAATQPSDDTVNDVVAFIRDASATDAATVQVLLTSKRFLILHEEVEAFIHDYLEANDVVTNSSVQSRALVLFSLINIMILMNDQFGFDSDCLDFIGPMLREALQVDPHDVAPRALHDAHDRIIPPPKADLRSQLAYHTFSAVGKSGYTKATISRISRRASCSPGAIYKIFPSKEDLVIGAIRSVMEAPWITITALSNILDEGALAQLLYSSASVENSVRKSFTLEIAMASVHNVKLRAAVQRQLQGLEALVPLIVGLSEEESKRLACLIRSVVLITLGVSFLSTVTKATEQIDFNQFAEPIRRALLHQEVTSWSETQRQLRVLAAQSRTARPGRL